MRFRWCAPLTGLIEQHFAGSQVQGVDTGAAARAVLEHSLPGLMLLDLRVDGGPELLQYIHREHATLPVVIISGTDASEDAMHALSAGAMGYVPERSDLKTLAQALHLVLAGGTHVPQLQRLADAPAAPAVPAQAWAEPPLTPRQKGVLALLARGLSNKGIARELNVSVDTVKDHVAAVLKALGVNSRTQPVVVATQKAR
jgi:DNA-binding NarL/FixJ family response regulator